MSTRHRTKKRLFLTGIFFLLLFVCMPGSAEAAIKKNSDNTYSYYNSKKVLQKNKWIKSGSKTYYADANGRLYSNGIYKIGKYWYAFRKNCTLRYGKCKVKGKTYYFALKTGRMQTGKWVNTNGHHFYFKKDGVMATSQWVGRYYVGKDGIRVKSKWRGSRYLGSDGKAYTGLHKIGKYYYYFDKTTYKKIVNTTKTVDGKTYTFDSKGRGTITSDESSGFESAMYSDPVVDDTTLMASIIYCEAGNQSYTGQLAVGMVIMNRVYNAQFPGTMKKVIYQKSQFEPSRNGSLTKVLKNPALVPDTCKQAAEEVLELYTDYKTGQKVYLKVNKKNVNFSSYLFFMTKTCYNGLGLTASKKTIGSQVFFKVWK